MSIKIYFSGSLSSDEVQKCREKGFEVTQFGIRVSPCTLVSQRAWVRCYIEFSRIQVFQEVLSLYPPGVGTLRESPSNGFKLSGYKIPNRTAIAISVYANHHNLDFWEDPESFDPSRFNPDRGKY